MKDDAQVFLRMLLLVNSAGCSLFSRSRFHPRNSTILQLPGRIYCLDMREINIALVAHDGRKQELLEWVKFNWKKTCGISLTYSNSIAIAAHASASARA